MLSPSCAPKKPVGVGPIKIGHLGDYTGSFAGKGQQIENGIKLRLDEARWEVAGRGIELVNEDTGSSAEATMDKIRKLVEVDKVAVVFGPLKMECLSAVAAFCSTKGVPVLNPGTQPSEDVKKYSTCVVPYGPQETMATGFGKYVYEKLGYKTTVSLSQEFVFGHTIIESFARGFKEKGGTFLKEVYIPFGVMDFTPYLVGVGQPDCLTVFMAGTPDALRFFRQYRELGLRLPVVCPEGGSLAPVLQELGDDIVGAIGTVPYSDAIDTDINRQFVENYQNKYETVPATNEERGYSITSVFLKGMEATGGDTTPVKVMGALENVKMDVPSGHLVIGADRLARKDVHIFKIVRKGDRIVMEIVATYVNELPR
jgi:branched-chain amino acid transport system substrate-binding protein